MNKTLLLLAALSLGCHVHDPPEEVLQDALSDWEPVFGTVSEECKQELLEIEIIETYSTQETMEACGWDEPIAGCYLYGREVEKIVYLRWWDDRYTLYHEFAHWAMWCSWGDVDGKHENKEVWDWAAEASGYPEYSKRF